ncbi:MAG: methyltransferase domain-containing protein [Planctomycetes bacterium]|nr:methyltransferase domain-containing protein [Planctomycetota bacterium]
MPLAAERLGPADASTLPGLAPEKGFYRGRQVAPVMGYQAADWLLRHDREETEQPEKVLEALAIAEGATVADVGAGAGYFTLRLARRVGPTGRVLATDLQEEMLELLRGRIAEAGLKNVEAVLATETDPKLPEGAVDLALLVDVYHELARPAEALAGLLKSLRPAADGKRPGRLVLVEYRGEDPSVPIKALHRTTVQQVRSEIEPAGFKLVEVKGFLPHQHVLVFERR